MKKRVYIIHGWDGYPEEGWFPWLKKELEKKGFQVQVPAMPEPAEPKIEVWVSHLAELVSHPNTETYFVGHSIGCQTILRYFETLPKSQPVGGAVFVAGWFTLMGLETEEERALARPWLETPMDFSKIRNQSDKFVAVFSDDDPLVPLENVELFQKNLQAKTIVLSGQGHFSGSDGIKKIPVVLKEVLDMITSG